MAVPVVVTAIKTSQLTILLGNGGSPEVFAHPCMINTSRGIEFSSSVTEQLVPYCPPDEDLPGWVERSTDSLSAVVSGAGIFDAKSLDIFEQWFTSGVEKKIRVRINTLPAQSPGIFVGQWILTGYSITGPGRRERVTFDCTIQSTGPITWTNSTI